MARSIHVEVRKAVIAGLVDAVNDPTVSVTYGWQGSDDTAKREQIFTSNARGTHDPAGMRAGRNFRNEHLEFDVTVMVEGVGMKPEEAETRAMDLGVLVEEFIADHKSNELDVDGLISIITVGFEADYRVATGAGSLAIVTYTIRYEARLT